MARLLAYSNPFGSLIRSGREAEAPGQPSLLPSPPKNAAIFVGEGELYSSTPSHAQTGLSPLLRRHGWDGRNAPAHGYSHRLVHHHLLGFGARNRPTPWLSYVSHLSPSRVSARDGMTSACMRVRMRKSIKSGREAIVVYLLRHVMSECWIASIQRH
jgi:hypothetical protein